jgi:hypothetical protein
LNPAGAGKVSARRKKKLALNVGPLFPEILDDRLTA